MRCSSSGLQILVRLAADVGGQVAGEGGEQHPARGPGFDELVGPASGRGAWPPPSCRCRRRRAPAPAPLQSRSTSRRWLGWRNTRQLLQRRREHRLQHVVVGDDEELGLALGRVQGRGHIGRDHMAAGRWRSSSSITASIGLPSASRIRPSTQSCGTHSISRPGPPRC